jgi:hypothetical protein
VLFDDLAACCFDAGASNFMRALEWFKEGENFRRNAAVGNEA